MPPARPRGTVALPRARGAIAAIGPALLALGGAAAVSCGGALPSPSSSSSPGERRGCPGAGQAVFASSQPELEALRGCARLAGLTIRSGAELSLEPLAQLAVIDGDLLVGPSLRLDALALPALRQVGGRLRLAGNSSLGGAYLPALERAGRIEIEHNASLATLSLPALIETAALIVRADAALEALSLRALTRSGELVLAELPRLGWIEAPVVQPPAPGGRLEIGALPAMEPAALDELRARVTTTAP